MPSIQTIFNWLHRKPSFFALYARAREIQAEVLADDIVATADAALIGNKTKQSKGKDGKIQAEVFTGDNVERSKLMVDARKWVASKLLPKKFGDRSQFEPPLGDDPLAETVAHMRALYEQRMKDKAE